VILNREEDHHMNIETLGNLEPFNDLDFGTLFYRGKLGMRVSLGDDRGVLLFDTKQQCSIVDGAEFANKEVMVPKKPTFQVTRNLAKWRFGEIDYSHIGVATLRQDALFLRCYHKAGNCDVSLHQGKSRRNDATESVAWTPAWRIVVNAGTDSVAVLFSSTDW
jgi:hypothetical protein